MKIIQYKEAEIKTYPGDTGKGTVGRVVIGKADGANKFCMRVFELAPGVHTSKHAHDWEHEVFVHAGRGGILRNGEWASFEAGTVIFIPGGEEHQLKNDGRETLTFVCLIPSGPPEM